MATIKQTQEDGTEIDVEVFSQEEVDAKLSEKETALKSEFDTKLNEVQQSITELSTEKEKLEKELGTTKEDNPNFKILKDALNKKDNEIKSVNEKLDSIEKQRKTEEYDLKIQNLSKGDTELAKKMSLQLSTTLAGMKDDTKEDRDKKIMAAYKLSVDVPSNGQGMFDGGIGGGDRGNYSDVKEGFGGVEFTSREKALGEKMGITAEDYKKYGNKVSKR